MEYQLPLNLKTRKCNSILYHYTSLHGAIAILQNAKIWASCSNYLNDYSEIEFTIEGFRAYLKDIHTRININNEKQHIEEILKYYNAQIRIQKNQIYISSFSEDSDMLSQWRAYGDDGYGICLGFDVTKLNTASIDDILNLQINNAYLLPVEYRSESLMELFDSLYCYSKSDGLIKNIPIFYTIEKALSPVLKLDTKEALRMAIFNNLERLSVCYKNNGFKEEKEWRIVKYDKTYDQISTGFDSNFAIRESGKKLIPYFEVAIDRSTIKEIIIGPRNNYDKMHYPLILLMHKLGYNYSIKKSSISYE